MQHVVSTPKKHYSYQTSPQLNDDVSVEHEKRWKEFKYIISTVEQDSVECLSMIDAIQRLGMDLYFQKEIEEILQRQYYMISKSNDLHVVALRFRLLRQQGYFVSPNVFNKFKNKEGKFDKNNISEDVRGLIQLYEASHLSILGENTLDEAQDFSRQALNEWIICHDHSKTREARNTLEYPFHKTMPMFTAKNFLIEFKGADGWIDVLQELAKLDFELVQSSYKKEIVQIFKWWRDLGLAEELKLARNQILKWYICSTACIADPTMSTQRVELTKPISFVYLIDDIFDVYGTLDELILFTEAVNGWDLAAIEQLPNYMRMCFKALDDITNDISCKVYKEHGWNPVNSLRKTWARLCDAFLVEAKWFASGTLPKAEKYLKNGMVSAGVHVVLVHTFFLLGQGLTEETVKFIDDDPTIISSTSVILRLWDDFGSAKDEDQEGHDGSYIKCYMNENKECSIEDARNKVNQMITKAWKQLNQECLYPNPFSNSFTKAALNVARMVPVMYSYDDSHCLPSLKEYMKLFLHEK